MRLVVVGGSDAGISAALRARELDPGAEVTVVVADRYPNFSICGIPYHVSGEVADWRSLAHRSVAELEAAGLELRLGTVARRIDVADRQVQVIDPQGTEQLLAYDALVVATGALPVRPPVEGLRDEGGLGPEDGVHLLHSMDDLFALLRTLEERCPATAVVVGGGYIGLEMAEALRIRGLSVTLLEQRSEVLSTLDPALGAVVREELAAHGVDVRTATTVQAVARSVGGLEVQAKDAEDRELRLATDLALVVVGVRPDTALAASAGAQVGCQGALAVDRAMRTNLPGVFAAGDCVVTHHRLLGATYLPLGTTAHKQGRVAGENAIGGRRCFAGSLGTQVLKVFDLVAARTGVRDHEAAAAGWRPRTEAFEGDDHKAYYPGSHRLRIRITGDLGTGRLLGLQLVGHREAQVAKRVDIAATAIFAELSVDQMSDLDLAYAPPLASPWDVVQGAAQAWMQGRAVSGVTTVPGP